VISLELYTKDNCSLCDKAKIVIQRVRQKIPFEFREIFLVPGTPLEQQLRNDIPVLHVNGAFFARHFISEHGLLEKLTALSASPRIE
jgi:hypothetical protein